MGGKEKKKKEINSDIGAKYLREAGIADKSIIFAPYGRDMFNTIQWADYEVRQYTEDGIGSSLFVGNDYHNYRIETTARDIGMITNLSPVKSKFLFSRFYHVLGLSPIKSPQATEKAAVRPPNCVHFAVAKRLILC